MNAAWIAGFFMVFFGISHFVAIGSGKLEMNTMVADLAKSLDH